MSLKKTATIGSILGLAVAGITLLVSSLSPIAAKEAAQPAGKAATSTPRVILFFMNPNGHPCQMQKAILDQIKDSLINLATVKYYKTTNDEDDGAFNKYGIRGLPSLVVADSNGTELSRFTPGIQSAETILKVLRAKKPAEQGKSE
jgi:hypothetical protein